MADVMIASMLAAAGIGNNLLNVVLDARQRFLKQNGVVIPLALRPSFCPVELPEWYESKIDCWNHARGGFSFRSARTIAVNQAGSWNIKEECLIADPQCFEEIRLAEIASANVAAKGIFFVERSAVFHALGAWFRATMAEGVFCSNSPLDAGRLPWNHLVLPIDCPTAVQPGDRIDAAIRVAAISRDSILGWDVWVYGPSGILKAEFHHSTFYGLLLAKEDLAKCASGSVPVLSERGKAELAVLSMCDGTCSRDEIAVAILQRFPRTLKSLAEARALVAEVLKGSRTETQDLHQR
jgi:hypothetical protein